MSFWEKLWGSKKTSSQSAPTQKQPASGESNPISVVPEKPAADSPSTKATPDPIHVPTVNTTAAQDREDEDRKLALAELTKTLLHDTDMPGKTAYLGSSRATGQDLLDAVSPSSGDDAQRVKALISHGADLNTKDKHGETALYNAVTWGYLECVKALIAAGADMDVSCSRGVRCTALHQAVMKGNVACVRALIAGGANVNKMATNDDGTPKPSIGTPLKMAIELLNTNLGRPDIVAALRAAGAQS
jgi:hypothetical protein